MRRRIGVLYVKSLLRQKKVCVVVYIVRGVDCELSAGVIVPMMETFLYILLQRRLVVMYSDKML